MQIVSDYVWEKLHTGHWKEVPLAWRQMHSATKFVSALAALTEGRVSDALQEVDKGILMGAPFLGGLLQKVASVLTDAITTCGDSGATLNIAVDQDEVVLAVPCVKKKNPEKEAFGVEGSVGAAAQLPMQTPAEGGQPPHRRPIRFRNYKSVCEAVESEDGTSSDLVEREPSCVGKVNTAASVKDRLYEKAKKLRKGAHIGSNELMKLAKPSNVAVLALKDSALLSQGNLDHPCPPVEAVPVLECPSLEEFYRHCMQGGRPALLEGCIDHWPAYKGERKWRYTYSACLLNDTPLCACVW